MIVNLKVTTVIIPPEAGEELYTIDCPELGLVTVAETPTACEERMREIAEVVVNDMVSHYHAVMISRRVTDGLLA
jgi:predicted RNase H-like HicB family nuclease